MYIYAKKKTSLSHLYVVSLSLPAFFSPQTQINNSCDILVNVVLTGRAIYIVVKRNRNRKILQLNFKRNSLVMDVVLAIVVI